MVWFIIVPCAFLLAVVLGVSYYAYRRCFRKKKRKTPDPASLHPGKGNEAYAEKMRALVEEETQMPYEDVYITSFDGLRLHGRLYILSEGASVQIQFHGYRDHAVRGFCGGSEMLRQTGRNALVVDQRAHGESEGKNITFGILERYDCLAWVRYISDRFGAETPIFITGVSMGGATVLMAADLALPENVVGILADCPYLSPRAIIQKVCGDMHLPQKLIYPFIWLGARIFGGFHLSKEGAVDAVRQAKVPILLVHGEADDFVPCEMSRAIAAACASEVQLELFPEATHAMCYFADPYRYQTVQKEFMEFCLQRYYAGRKKAE